MIVKDLKKLLRNLPAGIKVTIDGVSYTIVKQTPTETIMEQNVIGREPEGAEKAIERYYEWLLGFPKSDEERRKRFHQWLFGKEQRP